MKILVSVLLGLLAILPVRGQTNAILLATLNCYWFFGQEESSQADKPKTVAEYELKAGHLVGLLPSEPPLLVGLQEVGNGEDVQPLARSATARYRHRYQPIFVQGKDTATKQDVGALLDTSRGWGVYGRPSRVADLERELSKHLVARLTNATISLDICVVHLRRPMGQNGAAKQVEQNRALMRWTMRHLGKNPKANVVVLGDFNEGKPVGNPEQTLAVLFQSRPPMVDTLSLLKGKVRTHVDGRAYDRIIVSDAMAKGLAGLRLKSVHIQEHRHGKGEARQFYTDHFPVTARFLIVPK